jgi:hypothetical protein
MANPTAVSANPERKEIARYLLSRGLDPMDLTPEPARIAPLLAAAAPRTYQGKIRPHAPNAT